MDPLGLVGGPETPKFIDFFFKNRIFDGISLTHKPFPWVNTTSFVFTRMRVRHSKSKRALQQPQVQWHLPKVGQNRFDGKNHIFTGA